MESVEVPTRVEESEFRASLERIAKTAVDPATGLFGPDSMFWEVNRHAVVYFLGAIQSVQMQLCHPWIAIAVHAHSKILSNPRTRARLTYVFLRSLIYGDLATVTKMARALHKVHGRVEGTLDDEAGSFAEGSRYAANEVNALLWVHVTAFYCRIRLYESLVRKLDDDAKDRFVNEAKRYAYCFGIPESAHPSSWHEVEDYVDAMQRADTLARTDAGMTIRRFLEASLPWPIRAAVFRYISVSLPRRTRDLLDLPQPTARNLARAERFGRLLRVLVRALPAKLAYVPAWHEARSRIAGANGPDRITAWLNFVYLGRSRLVS